MTGRLGSRRRPWSVWELRSMVGAQSVELARRSIDRAPERRQELALRVTRMR
jgi:hypothetical protein